MNDKIYTVLFLCTGNSARSIMAEVMLNAMGKGHFKAYSAGSHPGGVVNSMAIEELTHCGFDVSGLRSKSWDEFASADAPHMDFVITVCDTAAGEVCPFWPGQPITAYWGFQDPAKVQGSEEEIRHTYARICLEIKTRLDILLSLPINKLEKLVLQRELDLIGATKV